MCRHQQEQQAGAILAGLGHTRWQQQRTRPSLQPAQQVQQGRTAAALCWVSLCTVCLRCRCRRRPRKQQRQGQQQQQRVQQQQQQWVQQGAGLHWRLPGMWVPQQGRQQQQVPARSARQGSSSSRSSRGDTDGVSGFCWCSVDKE
jgi:hypothetical protein